MGEQLVQLLKSVTVFLLAGRVILHFLPEGGYGKYVKMILSVMILAQLAVPFFSLGDGGLQETYQDMLEEYVQEMESIQRQVEEAGLRNGDYAEAGLDGAVQEKLASCAASLGVRIEGAQTGEEGTLLLQICEEEAGGTGLIRVEKIELPDGEAGQEGAAKPEKEKSGRTEQIRRAFAEELGVEEQKLEVIWND